MSISSNLQSIPKSKKESKTAWQVAPNLLTSFRYAWAGILYATRTQRNFRIHLVIALAALCLGIILHINTLEAAVIAVTISAVLIMELMNTALESVVDLTVGQTYHELAKIAKDCAAGAVLISAIAALLVAGFIYLPPFLVMLHIGIA
ncbi:MAG: diacylglycerol kinase family protein [Cyanobacteria bacterium P01_D01_bin.156]